MTEPTMPELLPCPFCGGPAEIWRAHDHPYPRKAWIACMGDCGGKRRGTVLTAEYEADADVVAAWNRRAPTLPETAPEAWIEAMARAIDPHGCNWENQLPGSLKDFARRQARAAYAALARTMERRDAE